MRTLSRSVLKTIRGGDGPADSFDDGGCVCSFAYGEGGTCGVKRNGVSISYGMSRDSAQSVADDCALTCPSSRWSWCCASC